MKHSNGRSSTSPDLFASLAPAQRVEQLAPGAVVLRGFAFAEAAALIEDVLRVSADAPFRHLVTPGGRTMSVAMTNCGAAGWVSDGAGYRYAPCDPLSGRPWPAMPARFYALGVAAALAAGYSELAPTVCLINRYAPGARLTLHQDRDESDFSVPIVSVSLGLPATFRFGGLERSDKTQRVRLENGDVVVWGGPSRLAYHGVDALAEGVHPLSGAFRYNLTFRS